MNTADIKVRIVSNKFSPAEARSRTTSRAIVFVDEDNGEGSKLFALPQRDRVRVYADAVRPLLSKGSRLRWSNTAGCRCGCSPSFIIDGPPVVIGNKVQDIMLTIRVDNVPAVA